MAPKKKKESPYWKYPKVRTYMQNYNKAYYLDNRKEIIADQTKRNQQNETQIKDYMKKYYANNRTKLLRYAKKRKK